MGDNAMPNFDDTSFSTLNSTAGYNISRQSLPSQMITTADHTPRDIGTTPSKTDKFITPSNQDQIKESKRKNKQIPNTAPPVLTRPKIRNNDADQEPSDSSSTDSDGTYLDETNSSEHDFQETLDYSTMPDGNYTVLDAQSQLSVSSSVSNSTFSSKRESSRIRTRRSLDSNSNPDNAPNAPDIQQPDNFGPSDNFAIPAIPRPRQIRNPNQPDELSATFINQAISYNKNAEKAPRKKRAKVVITETEKLERLKRKQERENKQKLQYFDELVEKFTIPNDNLMVCVKARYRLKNNDLDEKIKNGVISEEEVRELYEQIIHKFNIKFPQFLREKHPQVENKKGEAKIEHSDINEYLVKIKAVSRSSFSNDFKYVETKPEMNRNDKQGNGKKSKKKEQLPAFARQLSNVTIAHDPRASWIVNQISQNVNKSKNTSQ